jgi:hypothetical protein
MHLLGSSSGLLGSRLDKRQIDVAMIGMGVVIVLHVEAVEDRC